MSLTKWKELAKRKTELGNKINYTHNAITQHKIGQETSQESFKNIFKPITSKLDDVVVSNLTSRMPPQRRNQPPKKDEPEIDYMPEVDPYEEMDVEGLINMGDYVPPQKDEQQTQTLDEDTIDIFLNNIGLPSYEDIEDMLNQPEITDTKKSKYIINTIADAMFRRNQLKGHKTDITKQYNRGDITEFERNESNKTIDNIRYTLNEYIHYLTNKIPKKGRGIKQRGGSIIFFNDPKQLLKKLELIIGELIAGNTSIPMRNTGVSIHPFNKSRRHLEYLIYDVIRGKFIYIHVVNMADAEPQAVCSCKEVICTKRSVFSFSFFYA